MSERVQDGAKSFESEKKTRGEYSTAYSITLVYKYEQLANCNIKTRDKIK